ncbi:MAG: hypothetical protein IJA01_08800 [Firmicutes bacterium]|nr:hypothetical protein [Bacillota bacterium]
MELISKIVEKVKLSCYKTKIAITICIMIILGCHFLSGWIIVSSYRISSFFVSICLSVIIYLCIYFAPKLNNGITELENCFDELGYKYAYDQYKLNLEFKPKEDIPWIIYSKDCKGKEAEGKEKSHSFHGLVKVAYIICWIIITVYLVVALYKCNLIKINTNTASDISEMINLILFFVVMVLYGVSFYFCFANIYFLRTLGRKKHLEKWKYNKYLPATTNGFRQIFTYSKRCILVYLLVSSLYSLAYTIMIISHPDINSIDPRHVFCITFLVILIGAGTSIALFVASHIFIQRILNRWKRQSHIEFQKTLDGIDKSDLERIQTIIQLVKEMDKDKVNYDFRMILSVILSIVTIVLNSINIINSCGIFDNKNESELNDLVILIVNLLN